LEFPNGGELEIPLEVIQESKLEFDWNDEMSSRPNAPKVME
jgi:hypothetical protein